MPRLRARQGTRLEDARAAVCPYRRANEWWQVEVVEIERRERLCEHRDALARPQARVEQDDRLATQPAKSARQSLLREPPIDHFVPDRDPDPGGKGLERGGKLSGLQTRTSEN